MLPRSDCVWPPDQHRLPSLKSANQVRNQPILRPVSSANHIAGARSCQRDMVFAQPVSREVGTAIGRTHNLRACLARRIRIMPAERVRFAVRTGPLLILVAFVRRHANHRAHARRFPHGLQHMRRSHHIGRISSQWIGIRTPHQRLCSKMEYHLWRKLGHRRFELCTVANIAANILKNSANRGCGKQIWSRLRIKRVPANQRSARSQPKREPPTLESGVASEENPSPLPRIYHVFHGALPLAHRSSSLCFSRSVSIACQKPL